MLENEFDEILNDISNRFEICLQYLDIQCRKQLIEWKNKYAYKFQIYNDHLINGQPHFHLVKISDKINTKFDFNGNVLEQCGKNEVPKNIRKILIKFLNNKDINKKLNESWNKHNPIIL